MGFQVLATFILRVIFPILCGIILFVVPFSLEIIFTLLILGFFIGFLIFLYKNTKEEVELKIHKRKREKYLQKIIKEAKIDHLCGSLELKKAKLDHLPGDYGSYVVHGLSDKYDLLEYDLIRYQNYVLDNFITLSDYKNHSEFNLKIFREKIKKNNSEIFKSKGIYSYGFVTRVFCGILTYSLNRYTSLFSLYKKTICPFNSVEEMGLWRKMDFVRILFSIVLEIEGKNTNLRFFSFRNHGTETEFRTNNLRKFCDNFENISIRFNPNPE